MPPLTGVAVMVTGIPSQILLADAVMLTNGTVDPVTIPATAAFWLVAPGELRITLPDRLPGAAEDEDRT